jgi:hypothetical protein
MMPVWGLWGDGVFEFSTGAQSRKAKNFRQNPNVAVATESGEDAVVIEGVVSLMPEASHAGFIAAYNEKYDWRMEASFAPFYVVTPRVASASASMATRRRAWTR